MILLIISLNKLALNWLK